jgi:hypothetical protein
MWLVWVGAGLLCWLLVGALLGVVLGRGIRLADRHEAALAPRNFVVEADVTASVPR